MEEREALQRQIALLQNLIDKHKSVHGDAPQRARPRPPVASVSAGVAPVAPPPGFRGKRFSPQGHGSWRKTYSLKNKTSQVSAPQAAPPGLSASQSRGGGSSHATGAGVAQQEKAGLVRTAGSAGKTVAEDRALEKELKSSASVLSQTQQPDGVGRDFLGASSLKASSQLAPVKPSLASGTSSETHQTPPLSSSSRVTAALYAEPKKPPMNPHPPGPPLKASKFTWVKSQSVAGGGPPPPGRDSAQTPASTSAPAGRKPATKKTPRKPSPGLPGPRASKYRWVSSSAGATAKTPRKLASPRAVSQKADAARKLKVASSPSAKVKRGVSPSGGAAGSRYRWKAGGQRAAAMGGVATGAARRRSAFHWTSERSVRGGKAGPAASLTSAAWPPRASIPSQSPAGFKLRSRMKIIRRSTSGESTEVRRFSAPSTPPAGFKLRSRMKIIRRSASGSAGSERGSGPAPAKPSPRARSPAWTRRAPARELVSFGRHKLRRLPPSTPRTGPASTPPRGSAPQPVFRSRFKMVTRPGAGAAPHFNPALSWRARRVQSARSFLQSRRRASHPSGAGPWRAPDVCWIRGSLYRVSANKLSRTTSGPAVHRAGRGPGCISPASPAAAAAAARPSSTRHLASRAVQRSLAIIRLARQRRQPRQYCMYYNRFGRCNRGAGCPYIHDPDKVAVCTRFLRGTCKRADGTCPFSHKVAKEKMPVCSYFLKGICSNSDCPYSHVYVSRKAGVCDDFVRGYCPAGEKCKKKHTLVCPDFSQSGSCPRGTRCRLQHRQRAKRTAAAAAKETPKRPRLSVVLPQEATPGRSSLALPSFISLSSSPEESDAPAAAPARTSQVKERKLQIKPRL